MRSGFKTGLQLVSIAVTTVSLYSAAAENIGPHGPAGEPGPEQMV
jgi:hypothetical protein